MKIKDVAAGSHTLKLKLEGYKDWETTLRVTAGETAKFNPKLIKIRKSKREQPRLHSSEVKPRKFHIGLQGGGFTAQIAGEDDEYSESGGFTVLNFRYALNHRFDFVIDGRFWVTNLDEGDSVTRLARSSVGPGIRAVFELNDYLKWFIQGTLYWVREREEYDDGSHFAQGLAGAGVNSGVEIRTSDLISIPIGVTFLGVGEDDDSEKFSGVGVSGGLSFNF